jgi:hypothetical protein
MTKRKSPAPIWNALRGELRWTRYRLLTPVENGKTRDVLRKNLS